MLLPRPNGLWKFGGALPLSMQVRQQHFGTKRTSGLHLPESRPSGHNSVELRSAAGVATDWCQAPPWLTVLP